MPNSVNEPVLNFWYCFIRVRTTCRLLNSRSFPGVFQGINKKIQDVKVVNFTSIFFRISYLQNKTVHIILQLSLIDKFKEFSKSWYQNWIFKEFSRALEKISKIQEFSRNSRSSGNPISYAVHGRSTNYLKSVDEIPKCDYSVEKYWAVTFHGAVNNCAFWGGSNQAPGFNRSFYTVVHFIPSLSENMRLRLTFFWYKLPSFSHGSYG